MSIDPIASLRYMSATKTREEKSCPGGPDLLLPEIMGLLEGYFPVWVPFRESRIIAQAVWPDTANSIHVTFGDFKKLVLPEIKSVYFGTPTIVNDEPLFPPEDPCPTAEAWCKDTERFTVREIVAFVEEWTECKRIVSGLGSGDITMAERVFDMGENTVMAAMKHYTDFTNTLFVRDL